MAEYTANAVQTVNPGESIVFISTAIPCTRGLVKHSDGTGNFLLSGWIPNTVCSCACCSSIQESAEYLVDFGANVAVPTGSTVGEISVAIAIDGGTIPSSTMIATPAAVEQYFNVSRAMTVDVFNGCCQTVTVRNTSETPILVQNATIRLTRPDLLYSR